MPKKKFILKFFMAALLFLTAFCPTTASAFPLNNQQQVTVFHPSQERVFVVGKNVFKFQHFTNGGNPSTETLASAEITLAPNYDGFLLQKHVINSKETIYAIEGDIYCFTSDRLDRSIILKTGDIVQIPVGIPYGCKGNSSKPSKLLLIEASPALENLIAEVGIPADKQTKGIVEPDMAKVAATARKYGIEFLN
jgi:uncharacterized RmlC-like cupin family protein